MTRRGSGDTRLQREMSGVKRDEITDAYALDIHLRHLTSAGQMPESIRGRRGAILRLTDYLDPYGEDPRAVIDATSDELAEWQASKADLSAKTISVYLGHIREYYRWLVRPMRVLSESPAEDLIVPIVRRRKPRPIPEDELGFALTAAQAADRRLYAFLVLGAYAGLRSVDIAGLERDDVLTDQAVPMLRVRGKGGHEDVIPVGREVVEALVPFLGRRPGALFVTGEGRRMDRNAIRERVNDFLGRLGLAYTFHQLRHRYGTKVYEISKDIRHTQRAMRHRSIQSTELYVAAPTGQDVKTVRALDADLAQRRGGRRRDSARAVAGLRELPERG